MSALVDERGCLTPAGTAAVRQAPPGGVPADLARHLAECARCQARLLSGDLDGARPGQGRGRTGRGREASGRLWRAVVFMVAVLVLALGALAWIGARQP